MISIKEQRGHNERETAAMRDGLCDGTTAAAANAGCQVSLDLQAMQSTEEKLRQVNRALTESEQMFRLLIESVTDYALYMLDPNGLVATWNAGAEQHKGYRKEEILGQSFSVFFTPEDVLSGKPAEELAAATRNGRFASQGWRLRKDGTKFWAQIHLTAIRGADGELCGFAKVTRDLTRQKELDDAQAKLNLDLDRRVKDRTAQLEALVGELQTKNEEIESLVAMVSHDLNEKEVLLREVYHRVKNNLQVVQSLLKMGARSLQSPDARAAIETAVQRVHVMAMVHERLYQMPDLSALTLSSFLRDAVEGAIASNSEQPERIRLELDVEELPVPLDFAIPLGLLTNELVSNCLKHGIPRGGKGQISIYARLESGALRFAIQDDGAGLAEGFDLAKSNSMGLKLASSLAAQLGGRLEFISNEGCRVETLLSRYHGATAKSKADPESLAAASIPGLVDRKARERMLNRLIQ